MKMEQAAALSRREKFIHAKFYNLTRRHVCDVYTRQVPADTSVSR